MSPADRPADAPRQTQAAIIACAQWLAYCRQIGWRYEDLDFLETLWWQGHDHTGKLIQRTNAK